MPLLHLSQCLRELGIEPEANLLPLVRHLTFRQPTRVGNTLVVFTHEGTVAESRADNLGCVTLGASHPSSAQLSESPANFWRRLSSYIATSARATTVSNDSPGSALATPRDNPTRTLPVGRRLMMMGEI